MAVFKCKMCGGALELSEDKSTAVCDYCGSEQTISVKRDDVVMNLFNRANNLRIKNDFDKALEIYEKILNEDDTDAEAHWCTLLCKYGIEYVEDPKTHTRIPTCHRAHYDSILTDADYLAALENADFLQKPLYEAQGRLISELQKEILSISSKEEPFDVFICYKETDENGNRTIDSSLANDVYYQLTQAGMKVFYAAITLEEKLGKEYEPYIFAALHSAKVMVVIGTNPEYFGAAWVKNEWSRYLALVKNEQGRTLIPCYRDMDAYDLPEEFAHLQALDMSKIGFVNDLVRGIKKLTEAEQQKAATDTEPAISAGTAANIDSLIKRIFMFLDDGEWKNADQYCEKVLDIDPENALAYLGKLMAEFRVRERAELSDCPERFDGSNNCKKAMRFGDENLKSELNGYINAIIVRKQEEEARAEQHRKKMAKMRKRSAVCASLVSAGDGHTVGLKADGTVVAVGYNNYGQCKVSGWRNIVAISAGCGDGHTVGLKSDGTVVACGYKCNHQCDVSVWRDIVAISAGSEHTVGLKSNGKVVACGENGYDQCDVSDWCAIVAISAGCDHTVGLKADGTVVATKYTGKQEFNHGQCEVSGWCDIVAISAGSGHTVGLKADGTVVATKYTGDQECNQGQCEVANWKLYNSIDTLKDELKAAKAKHAEQAAEQAAHRTAGVCQHCGGKFKGMFSKKCSQCGKPKDY